MFHRSQELGTDLRTVIQEHARVWLRAPADLCSIPCPTVEAADWIAAPTGSCRGSRCRTIVAKATVAYGNSTSTPLRAGESTDAYGIFEGTEQIQQLVISRAISGMRVE